MATGSRATFWRLAIVATGIMVGLKLTGQLAWPWLGVTAPLWVPLVVSVSVRLALLAVILGAVWWFDPGGLAGEIEALAVQVGTWLTP